MVIIPNNQYGNATQGIQQIGMLCERIDWFHLPKEKDIEKKVSDLILFHLSCLKEEKVGMIPEKLKVSWIIGPLTSLNENIEDIYDPWKNRWHSWRTALRVIIQGVGKQIENTPQLKERFCPPLWPVTGNPFICGEPVIAREEILYNLGMIPLSLEWKIGWLLLCQAENHLWNSYIWEIWKEYNQKQNLFIPLLEIYKLGLFPMGWEDNNFYFFSCNIFL